MKENKISDELMQKLILQTDNPFVEDFDVRTGKFTYSKDFYIKLGLLINREHCSAREAFEKMGFDTTVLSANQMSCADNYAKKKLKDKNYTIDPSHYDGSVEPELMTGLTMEEELAYLKARNLYLEVSLDLQKKKTIHINGCSYLIKEEGVNVDKNLAAHSLITDNNHRVEKLSKQRIFKIAGVSSSGYYAWINRLDKRNHEQEKSEEEDNKMKEKMRQTIQRIGYVPGKRSFKLYLQNDFNIRVSIKLCRRLMQEMYIKANKPKKGCL